MEFTKDKPTLKVGKRKSYGKMYYYPCCRLSDLIVVMMGDKYGQRTVLTERDINFMKEYGVNVEIQGENNE